MAGCEWRMKALIRSDIILNHFIYEKPSTEMGGKIEDGSTRSKRLFDSQLAIKKD